MDFLANRYGTSPYDLLDWDLFDSVVFYYAAVRNQVRDRIVYISDRVASGDISAEMKHYDKHGREIKGEGKSDPVGFKEHMRKLYAMIGIEENEPNRKENLREKAAEQALNFFTKGLGMGGGG